MLFYSDSSGLNQLYEYHLKTNKIKPITKSEINFTHSQYDSKGKQVISIGSNMSTTNLFSIELKTLVVTQLTNTNTDKHFPSYLRVDLK